MLVVDPRDRATLQEIMNHPWMTKGFNSAPDNCLPQRDPLTLPLDAEVIEKMQGFDFGSAAYITEQLTRTIESEEYQTAIRKSTREEFTHNSASAEKKRGVFDFYRRRNSISREGLTTPSTEQIRGSDPLNAYSPLVSIYYLAREKRDREKRASNPGALSLPVTPGEQPLKVPGLSSPEAAHTNTFAPEMPGEKATGGRARPRARTNGEEDVVHGIRNVEIADRRAGGGGNSPQIPPPEQPQKKEGTALGLLRRFSTRRYRERESDRPIPPALNIQPPQDSAASPRKSFSVRRSRTRRDPSPSTHHAGGSQPQHEGLLSASGGFGKAGKFLGRSTSVNSADYRPRRLLQRGAAGNDSPLLVPEPPATSGSDQSSVNVAGRADKGVELQDRPAANASPLVTPRTPNSARTKSLGHARQESIQARRKRHEERRDREANVPEETDADMRDHTDGLNTPALRDTPGTEISRPAGLKGLFSTSTTSSKAPQFIRQDIIRVLDQLGVQYTVIKGGFSCRHAPSINLDGVKEPADEERSGRVVSGHQRRISFGGAFRGKDREDVRDDRDRDRERLTKQRRRQPDQSFVTNSEGSDEYLQHGRNVNHEAGHDGGATRTRVQDDTGERLVLRFEIGIVKIPLLSLHGIQFKKVQGGMNQYRSMTSAILNSLRL